MQVSNVPVYANDYETESERGKPLLAVTLAEARERIRISDDVVDDIVRLALRSAVDSFEEWCNRSVLRKTYQAALPARELQRRSVAYLPRPPYAADGRTLLVETLNAGAATALDAGAYYIDSLVLPARFVVKDWALFPGQWDTLRVRWRSGYGDGPATIPDAVRLAICYVAASFVQSPVDVEANTYSRRVPGAVGSLVDRFKVPYRSAMLR